MRKLSPREYAQALANAVASVELRQRKTVIDHFLAFLRRQRASALLPRIQSSVQQLDDQARGVTRVSIMTAMPMTEATLRPALEKAFGKVLIETQVDPSLIGGVTIRVGDQLVDGSVRAELNALHTHLMTDHV